LAEPKDYVDALDTKK